MIMLAALALAQASAPAASQPTGTEGITMVGAGAQLCRTWSRHTSQSGMVRMNDIQWVQGFLSGANLQATLQTRRSVLLPTDDFNALVARVDTYCAANPDKRASEGAQALWEELVARPRP
jgi:hypothetical protein